MSEVSREELVKTIADFLEMGHVENIIAMFKQEPAYHELAAEVIRDERFMVRMGMAVLYEDLAAQRPGAELNRAVGPLTALFDDPVPYVRGEAANLLAIINTPESRTALERFRSDHDPQVQEIVADALAGGVA